MLDPKGSSIDDPDSDEIVAAYLEKFSMPWTLNANLASRFFRYTCFNTGSSAVKFGNNLSRVIQFTCEQTWTRLSPTNKMDPASWERLSYIMVDIPLVLGR